MKKTFMFDMDTDDFPVSLDVIEMIGVDMSKAQELIRCKDCKHWDGQFCHNKWWGDGHGAYTPPIKTEEGYCDWAERKEE